MPAGKMLRVEARAPAVIHGSDGDGNGWEARAEREFAWDRDSPEKQECRLLGP